MISKLSYGNSVYGIISYNEDKVKTGEAKPVFCENFPKEMNDLSFAEKVKHFKNFTDLNSRTKRNAYHFVISFAADDRRLLTQETKENIVRDYMKGIGLQDQPFLVYEHFDTDHPHMHIATININDEGNRIDIYRNVHEKSETIRKQIELQYDLTIAENRSLDINQIPNIEKRLQYGKQPTKANLAKAVNLALNEFKPVNIEEFKHVLTHYGISLDEGREGTIQKEKGGITYNFIDHEGNQDGKGIKASSLSGKPILYILKKEFDKNIKIKEATFKTVAQTINTVFHNHIKFTPNYFEKLLLEKGISSAIKRNEKGEIEQIYYTHISDGTVFSSNEFRLDQDKLRQKFGDYSLSKTESKNIGMIISSAYRNQWRSEEQPYESTFLENFDKNFLLEKILINNPKVETGIVTDSFNNYIEYKNSRKLIIFKNDLQKFNEKYVAIVRYISSKNFPYSTSEKVVFLKEFGLETTQKGGSTQISTASDSLISIGFAQDVNLVLNGKNNNAPHQKLNYTPADKRLLFFLAERKNEHTKIPANVNLYLYKKEGVRPFISDSDVKFIETTITREYAGKLTKLVENKKIKSVQELMDYGFLIEPLTGNKNETNFIMRYHDNKREYSIPVTGALREFVIAQGYNTQAYKKDFQQRYSEHHDNFTLKYRLVSKLNRIGITKSYSGLVNAHEIIGKRNHAAGRKLNDFVLQTYNNSALSTKQQYEKIRVFTLDLVKNINDKEIGNDHLKQGQITLGADKKLIASNAGIKMQKGSDYEEERRRKRLIKAFYNDLER